MRYNNSIDLNDRNKSHTRIIGLVPERSRVLDVGCSTGFLGEYLIKEKKCVVDGIEYDEQAGAIASKKLNGFIRGDVEDDRLINNLNGKTYDVIIAGDILEHLKDPSGLLRKLSKFLSDNGKIILSLPNIAHFRIRANLLLGRFEYTEEGIMDSTHLRFFTHDTAKRLITDSGYTIVHEEHTLGPRIGALSLLENILPKKLFAAQFIFVIKPVIS
ncbi:MAG: class I SAM-dependent methyltransferase [Nitrospirae bacterium]|nr:class I SAM-dependent methyltransferase [Nitrospirota bacterium]